MALRRMKTRIGMKIFFSLDLRAEKNKLMIAVEVFVFTLTLNFAAFAEAQFQVDFVIVQIASPEGYLGTSDGESEGSVVALDVFLNVFFQTVFASGGYVVRAVGVAVDFYVVSQLQPKSC